MPKVSVIIPTYQSVKFVREAIESVLAQTFKNYEVIVVEGGSTDGTVEVLNSYGNRIRVISQNGKGIANARNVGVLASKGEYITFLDSDDLWLPNKLEIQVKFLENKPDTVGLIYSDALFFVEEGVNKSNRERSFQTHRPHKGKILDHLLRSNFIPASTVMIRKLCFEKIGFFDESLFICEDIDMWIRIAETHEIDYQNMVLAQIRWHKGSVTQNRELHLQNLLALQNKILPHLLKETRSKKFYRRYYGPYLTFGIRYLLTNEPKMAKQKFRQYIKLYPYNVSAYLLFILTLFPFSLSKKLKLNRHVPRSLGESFVKNIAK